MLPKRERIAKGNEIKGVLNRKRFHFSCPLLYFAVEENNLPCSRLAVVCLKKIGNAVLRNRAKRMTCTAFSKIRKQLIKKIDLVVVPRNAERKLEEYLNSLLIGLKEAGAC